MRDSGAHLGWRRLGALVISLALCACGGGGGGSVASTGTGGIGGTGMSVGSVTGFGSVFVNGTEFDTSAATIVVDGAGATQSDLRVGQIVVVNANFTDGKASRIEYRARIKGPIQALTVQDAAVAASSLTVLGQTVRTNSATNLSGAPLDPAVTGALQVGDLVEISGLVDANGVLVATFLERRASLAEYQVIGTVANLTATTFRIGTLTVDFSTVSATPAVGETVEVEGVPSGFSAGSNSLVADRVEALNAPALAASDRAEVEGYITRFASATDFDVGGVRATVDSQTTFDGGGVADLAQNVKVELKGRVNSNGVLVAQSVKFESTGAIRLEGTIEQVNASAARVTVLGVPVTIGAGTDLEDNSAANVDPLTIADLAPSNRVEIRGFLDGNSVVASELVRDDPRPDARLRGRVTSIDPANARLSILGTAVAVDGATQYGGASDQAAFFATVRVGDFVQAEWNTFTTTSSPVDKLSIEAD